MQLNGKFIYVKVGPGEDDTVLARNQPAAMPRYNLPLDYPTYGQIADYQIKILNEWGRSKGLKTFDAAIETFLIT